MQVMEVIETGVDAEARWTKKAGKHQFGYKQHVLVNDDGLVLHVASTPANTHDSKALPQLLERSKLPPNTRVHADKAYTSKFHSELLKSLQLKNGIQDKAETFAKVGERDEVQGIRNTAGQTYQRDGRASE